MHAWNYGKRIAEGGLGPPSLIVDVLGEIAAGFKGPEHSAFTRQGPHVFYAWALRGWWAAHTERSSA